jgi:NADP-dependent 3-hydroxy acid dehydrogenase YdfG
LAVKQVLAQRHRIDVLINNAGVASAGVTEAFTPDQAKAVVDTNVIGLLRTVRSVLPVMRGQGDGLIINVGSILGRVTFPFFGIYGASKFAVEALTDSLRYEVSQLGVDVALVQPSAYPTPMYAKVQQPADADRTAAYGAVGEIPGAMFKHFMTTFQAADAPNPHDVAEAIAKLVALPKGNRPARSVVGAAFGSDTINEQTADPTPIPSGHLGHRCRRTSSRPVSLASPIRSGVLAAIAMTSPTSSTSAARARASCSSPAGSLPSSR